MIKHGASHGFSVLVCTILSAFIVELFKPLLPEFIENISEVSAPIIESLKIPIDGDYFTIILLAMILAILWGMFFKKKFIK